MKLPLFVLLRCAKRSHNIPAEIKHSPILAMEYMQERSLRFWLFTWEAPCGRHAIAEIADRICGARVVSQREYDRLQMRIAARVYESSTQLRLFERRTLESSCPSKCGEAGGLVHKGRPAHLFRQQTIPIAKAKLLPCRWCGAQVAYKEEWKDWRGTIRCNARDCRRIEHLRHKPQSKGGIELTPAQRKSLDREAWDSQAALNYLQLLAKELKQHGRKSTDDLRRH